ncbi:MAG: hypothetical protein J5685_01325 [Clostridiales bacterium]|nr:hypothetical protein [Clostridiales bacterium]
MAYTIRIYEKDRILLRLLADQLKINFPDAFIKIGDCNGIPDLPDHDDGTRYVYDNTQFDGQLFPAGAVPLRNGAWVDMRRLLTVLSSLRPKDASERADSSFHLLFPFSYIEERESFIDSYFADLKDQSDIPVRIDLMSSMRMAGDDRLRGALTDLLKACVEPGFTPGKVLGYLNPGSGGYLTAGLPEYQDDVFDLGIECVLKLLSDLKSLASMPSSPHFILAVAEGFRTADMCRICAICPNIHILLPSRMNAKGMDEAVDTLKRAAGHGNITIHYAQDLRRVVNE